MINPEYLSRKYLVRLCDMVAETWLGYLLESTEEQLKGFPPEVWLAAAEQELSVIECHCDNAQLVFDLLGNHSPSPDDERLYRQGIYFAAQGGENPFDEEEWAFIGAYIARSGGTNTQIAEYFSLIGKENSYQKHALARCLNRHIDSGGASPDSEDVACLLKILFSSSPESSKADNTSTEHRSASCSSV